MNPPNESPPPTESRREPRRWNILLRVRTWLPAVAILILVAACGGGAPPASATAEIESVFSTSKTSLAVTFKQQIGEGAENPGNYVITGPGGQSLGVVAAYLQPDGRTVILGTQPQQEATYALTVRHVRLAGTGTSSISASASFGGSTSSAPIVASAIALDNQQVLVTFLDPGTGQGAAMGTNALNEDFYEIAPALRIESAEFYNGGADTSRIVLTTASQDDVLYTVKVTNVTQQTGGRLVDPFNNTASWHGIAGNDTTAPTVIGAAATSNTTVQVSFSEPVSGAAADSTLYAITSEIAGVSDLVVTGAALNPFSTQVTLTTLPMQEGATYTVAATGIRDKSSNSIDPAANSADFIGMSPNGSPAGDTVPPRVSNVGSTGNTTVLVTFTEPVLGGTDSAENPAHYRITASIATGALQTQATLIISDAVLRPDKTTVELTTLSQSDLLYTVEIVNVKDRAGNQIAPPDRFHDPSTLQFHGTPPSEAAGENVDSDGDGLTDAAEQRGWLVTVTLADGRTSTREVTSDPGDPSLALDDARNVLARDTDGDGVEDKAEKTYLTDPRSADTDADELTDHQELNEIYTDPANQDSDGDSLADGLEFNFFLTSPLLDDTDGDQIPDDEEVLQANRNARAADLPRHAIDIGDVVVELNVTFEDTDEAGATTSSSESFTSTLTETKANELSSSSTETQEWYAKASNTTEAGGSYPGGFSAGTKFTAEAGVGASGTYVQSESSKQASEQTYQDSLESNKSEFQTSSVVRTVSGATLVVPVTLRNINDISFTMSDIEITALIPDPRNPTRLRPIGTLFAPENASTTYNLGTIDTRLGPFKFSTSAEDINPDLIETLLRDPSSIVLKVSNFNITDELGNQFSYQQQDVTERTAPVLIDFGDGRVERHWAATNTGRPIDTDGDSDIDGDDRRVLFDAFGKPVGVTLRQVLEEVMGLEHFDATSDTTDEAERLVSYASDSSGTITRIRDVEVDDSTTQAWHILTDRGTDPAVGVDDIILTRGSSVGIVFIIDKDNDAVSHRVEYLYGTYDDPAVASDAEINATDSDSDGLDDFTEIYQGYAVSVVGQLPYTVFSSPTKADTDGDGLDDEVERTSGTFVTDATVVDTDGDGACDGDAIAGCPIDQYPLDPTQSGRPPLLAEYLFEPTTDDPDALADTSGSGNALTLRGDGACRGLDQPDRFSVVQTSYWLNDPLHFGAAGCGTDADYSILEAPHLDVSEDFSIAFWVRPNGGSFVMGQHDATAFESWIAFNVGGGSLSFTATDPSDSSSNVSVSASGLVNDAWAFYAVTVDYNSGTDTTTMTLYTATDDGTDITVSVAGTTSFSGALVNPSGTDPFLIGADDESGNQFQGSLDEIRVYDGVLSPINLSEIYGALVN